MNPLKAVLIVQGEELVDSQEQFLEAVQYLIDTKLAWSLEGSIGRTCAQMIQAGLVSP